VARSIPSIAKHAPIFGRALLLLSQQEANVVELSPISGESQAADYSTMHLMESLNLNQKTK
jgi:hypothetical protein